MVKLQKRFAYKYKDKEGNQREHYKHVVTIPEEALGELGWREGEELEPSVSNDKLIFTKKSSKGGKR